VKKDSLANSHPLFDGAVLACHLAAPLEAAQALFCFSLPNQIIASAAAHGAAAVIARAVLVAPDTTRGNTYSTCYIILGD